eukprot:scaffold4557_cov142-Amphora_coffeaeformis.AAC.1
MSKQGGLMKIFRPLGRVRGAKENAICPTNLPIQKQAVKGEESSSVTLAHDRSPRENSATLLENECNVYLESEIEVDEEVFRSLPIEMRKEIMCNWKERHQTKRHVSNSIMQSNKQKRPKKNENTLDSFFLVLSVRMHRHKQH